MPRRGLLVLAVVLAPVLAGCGGGEGSASAGGRPQVVATTTQVADLARNVAGDRAEVRGLLAANADPHDYELRPSDLDGLTEASLVLRSGGDVDEWLAGALEDTGAEAPVLTLADRVETIPGDPHWWQDPRNAGRAVAAIRDALTRADPAGAATYRDGAERYLARIRALDTAVADCFGRIPEARRKLVTTHDALGYFARRYGIDVVGTVIPSRSTRGQPSAGATAALVRTIRREGVRAIFAETAVAPKVERAIARESGAKVGEELYADTLGPAGSPGATYLGSVAANANAIAAGLSGGAVACDLPAS